MRDHTNRSGRRRSGRFFSRDFGGHSGAATSAASVEGFGTITGAFCSGRWRHHSSNHLTSFFHFIDTIDGEGAGFRAGIQGRPLESVVEDVSNSTGGVEMLGPDSGRGKFEFRAIGAGRNRRFKSCRQGVASTDSQARSAVRE